MPSRHSAEQAQAPRCRAGTVGVPVPSRHLQCRAGTWKVGTTAPSGRCKSASAEQAPNVPSGQNRRRESEAQRRPPAAVQVWCQPRLAPHVLQLHASPLVLSQTCLAASRLRIWPPRQHAVGVFFCTITPCRQSWRGHRIAPTQSWRGHRIAPVSPRKHRECVITQRRAP